MKPRNQNKILARSSKTTVVLFVIMLFLLFEKTESGESSESTESGESSESTESTESSDSTDSIDSMFQNSCASRLFDTVRCNFARLLKHNYARFCNFQLNFHLILSEAPIQPQTLPHAQHPIAIVINNHKPHGLVSSIQ